MYRFWGTLVKRQEFYLPRAKRDSLKSSEAPRSIVAYPCALAISFPFQGYWPDMITRAIVEQGQTLYRFLPTVKCRVAHLWAQAIQHPVQMKFCNNGVPVRKPCKQPPHAAAVLVRYRNFEAFPRYLLFQCGVGFPVITAESVSWSQNSVQRRMQKTT